MRVGHLFAARLVLRIEEEDHVVVLYGSLRGLRVGNEAARVPHTRSSFAKARIFDDRQYVDVKGHEPVREGFEPFVDDCLRLGFELGDVGVQEHADVRAIRRIQAHFIERPGAVVRLTYG